MKKLLLASALAIVSYPAHAMDINETSPDELKNLCDQNHHDACLELERRARFAAGTQTDEDIENCAQLNVGQCRKGPSAQVTVTPTPYQGPPPIGWVYGPYTQCANQPQCSMGMVSVGADGLNVRVTPNGPPVMALVNGVPLYPVRREGDWLLVAAACDLTPTFAWSWTAGVPLNRCWVYF